MPFRLRRDCRQWFRDLAGTFSLEFDMYYLSLMAGMATFRKTDISTSEATDLVNDFPGEYRPMGRVIIALFLSRELQMLGIDLTERAELHNTIRTYTEAQSACHLSEAGIRELNRYAFGGFDVLKEWFEDRPRSIETFLPLYKRHLDQALENGT